MKKLRGADKLARIPVKVIATDVMPTKPEWIRAKISQPEEIGRITTVEEAACPNRMFW